MGKGRTNLYVVCLVLFPLAFAGFVIGFGCPVWTAIDNGGNKGLWQSCKVDVFKNCTTLDFDQPKDWMIGVRAVEIFALVMLTIAAIDLAYENCFSTFRGRQISERMAPGILCILGGLGGIAGIITYAVKTNDQITSGTTYGWALALLAAGSGLAVIVGVGFCVSGCFLEKSSHDAKAKHNGMNGNGMPYVTSNNENYELQQYTNRAMYDENGRPPIRTQDNLPGYALYNGLMDRPGQRMSLPPGPSALPPGYNGAPVGPKASQYYSWSDDRILDPAMDLSEGFMPRQARPSSAPRTSGGDPYSRGRIDDPYNRGGPAEDPYSRGGGGRGEDPYSRGGRAEDPYSRGPPRAGYDDPYGFDRADRAQPYGRSVGGGAGPAGNPIGARDTRDSFYRPGRF